MHRGAFLVCAALGLGLALARPADAGVTYTMGFSDYSSGSVLQWLAGKGFKTQRDAANSGKVVYSFGDRALVQETRKHALGLLLNEVNIPAYSHIRIEWGVDAFPPGASYSKGVRSDAVMVYVFFGSEKISSGSLLIPNSPYFIGLFLCAGDPTDHPFKGRYFHAGGRYVCVDHATAGQTVVTDYPIADAFARFFNKGHPPEVSGLGVAIDTDSAKGDGVAKAFIKKIEFIK
jgi:hypothetical protein